MLLMNEKAAARFGSNFTFYFKVKNFFTFYENFQNFSTINKINLDVIKQSIE